MKKYGSKWKKTLKDFMCLLLRTRTRSRLYRIKGIAPKGLNAWDISLSYVFVTVMHLEMKGLFLTKSIMGGFQEREGSCLEEMCSFLHYANATLASCIPGTNFASLNPAQEAPNSTAHREASTTILKTKPLSPCPLPQPESPRQGARLPC